MAHRLEDFLIGIHFTNVKDALYRLINIPDEQTLVAGSTMLALNMQSHVEFRRAFVEVEARTVPLTEKKARLAKVHQTVFYTLEKLKVKAASSPAKPVNPQATDVASVKSALAAPSLPPTGTKDVSTVQSPSAASALPSTVTKDPVGEPGETCSSELSVEEKRSKKPGSQIEWTPKKKSKLSQNMEVCKMDPLISQALDQYATSVETKYFSQEKMSQSPAPSQDSSSSKLDISLVDLSVELDENHKDLETGATGEGKPNDEDEEEK